MIIVLINRIISLYKIMKLPWNWRVGLTAAIGKILLLLVFIRFFEYYFLYICFQE